MRAADAAGNVDPSPAVRSFTVSGPDTSITAGPSGTVRSTTAALSFAGSPAPAAFECSLGGAPFAACTPPATYTGLLPGSTQTFRVRAIGADGLADATPATRTWSIESAAGVGTTLSAGPDPVKPKGTLTYTLRVSGTGPEAADGVATTQAIPTGLTVSSVATTQGTCTTSGSPVAVRCAIGSLGAGATATVTVRATVTAKNNTVLTSTAVATSTSWDPTSSDDAATTSTLVRTR